jgi:predicted HicB family RNase H-like nuclease
VTAASAALSYKGYVGVVRYDPEDEILVGRIGGINDVVGFHAPDAQGVKAAFREAVDDYIATCKAVGKKPEKAYSGQLMLRIDPQVHASAAAAALAAGASLNEWAEERLREAAQRDIARTVAA